MAKKEFRKDLMHKSRKELVDYVFRGEAPSKTFGYQKISPNIKRKVGEKWEDENSKYEQKEGYILKTGKNHEVFQEIRNFLKKYDECSNPKCTKLTYGHNDKLLIKQSGYCIDCNLEMDLEAQKLKIFEEYKNFRLFKRAISKAHEAKIQIQDGIKDLKPHYERVLEDGSIEVWHLPKSMDEMKDDMELEIKNIDKGLKELEEDIVIYETKLKSFNNPILNKLFDAR